MSRVFRDICISLSFGLNMVNQDVVNYFSNIVEKEKDISPGIAAIMTLLEVLKHDKSETIQELSSILKAVGEAMTRTDYPKTAVVSGSELFLRFVTLTNLDTPSLTECKMIMLQRGEFFLKYLRESRSKIAELAKDFICDGSRILTHSKSRVVLQAMIEAANANKRFQVFVLKAKLDNSGLEMCQALKSAGIQCTLVLDAAVCYVMEQMTMVMVGAEGVVASGGIISKVGCYTMAVGAKEAKKPLYVLTESFKFLNYFPLNQRDLRDDFKFPASKLQSDLSQEHPHVDYIPPAYIRLFFTDLGILTPTAVTDELIKLYL